MSAWPLIKAVYRFVFQSELTEVNTLQLPIEIHKITLNEHLSPEQKIKQDVKHLGSIDHKVHERSADRPKG
jgi:hypothetical protein